MVAARPKSEPIRPDNFWSNDFWEPTEPHQQAACSGEADVTVDVVDKRSDRKPILKRLGGKITDPARQIASKPADTPAMPAATSRQTSSRATTKPSRQKPVTSKPTRHAPTKQQLSGINLTVKAMKLAWSDQSGGKFTAAFTRTVIKFAPVFVADDALVPVTLGAAAPISGGTDVVLLIGAVIYYRKVRKYRKQLSEGRR